MIMPLIFIASKQLKWLNNFMPTQIKSYHLS